MSDITNSSLTSSSIISSNTTELEESKVPKIIEENNDDDNNVSNSSSNQGSSSSNTVNTMNETTEIESKEPNFTEVFEELFKFCFEILKYNMTGEIKLESVGGSNIIRTFLNNYYTIFKKLPKSTKHVIQIQEAWKICEPHLQYKDNSNSPSGPSGPSETESSGTSESQEPDIETFAEWLEKYSVSIKPPTENTKAKIMISTIFNNSLRIVKKLMTDAERFESKGNQDEANKIYDNPAIHYSNFFLLHLFRLFQFDVKTIIDSNTGNKITKIVYSPIPIITASITTLEKELGLTKNEIPSIGGEIGDLLSSMPELINDLGIELPDELSMKGKGRGGMQGGLKQAMKDIKTKPEMKGLFQNLLSGINMKDPASLMTALNRVTAGMSQNAMNVPDAVKRANAASVDNPTGQLSLPSTSSNSSSK